MPEPANPPHLPKATPGSRVAVLAAMVPELAPIVRRFSLSARPDAGGRVHVGQIGPYDVVAAVTSMGTEAATRVSNAVLDGFAADHVIVVGIAGGIGEGIRIGDLVCPEVAVMDGVGQPLRASGLGTATLHGSLLTTDTLYSDPSSIAQLRAQGHLAVDMETAAIAAVAEARGIPWTAFRVISDIAGDPRIDHEILGLSKPDGTPDPLAIVRFVVTRPWRIPQLVELGRGMRLAVRSSTRAALEALLGAGQAGARGTLRIDS